MNANPQCFCTGLSVRPREPWQQQHTCIMPLGLLLPNRRVLACISVQTRQLKAKIIIIKKAFKVHFSFSCSSPFLSKLSPGNKAHAISAVCVYQLVSPCYFNLASQGLQRSQNCYQLSANSWPDESCPTNPFLEGNGSAHTHMNISESKNQLNFEAHVGKQALLFFHLGVPWGKCGLTLQGVETTQNQGIINVVKTE